MSAMDRSNTAQLRDAAVELWQVLAPAVGFGLVGVTIALVAGSVIFERAWLTALVAVMVLVMTVVPIVYERIHTLGGR